MPETAPNRPFRLLAAALLACTAAAGARAAAPAPTPTPAPADTAARPAAAAVLRLGGQLKLRGALSWPEPDTLQQPHGDDTFRDGSLTGRVIARLTLRPWLDVEAHWEAGAVAGDSWETARYWSTVEPGLFRRFVVPGVPPVDARRLFDLTRWVGEGEDGVAYHRLDRLAVTASGERGLVRLGRQAVTWGHGLVFNPMDLFDPFSPFDLEREYKIGEDMAFAQAALGAASDLQVLAVARRDPLTGTVRSDQSSYAAKLHLGGGAAEWDLMAAEHFGDRVVGVGATGTLGDAAWRVDATWTSLDEPGRRRGYLSAVADLDSSWRWWGRSVYGLVEVYVNGLGDDDPAVAVSDPALVDRLARGELFTVGRAYLSGHLRVEVHPLCRAELTVVGNLGDGSAAVLPRLVWDLASDLRLSAGGSVFLGGADSELGGFPVPQAGLRQVPADALFAWLGWYF